jgi:NAD(P)-dependent dehydrogenase (short-subunit alcohol dehydrogenase family)
MDNLPTDFFVTSAAYTPTVYRGQYPSVDPANPALSQAGKVVIITGASDGIGQRGFAPAFAKAKPRAIILVGRSAAKLAATENALRSISNEVEYLSFSVDIADQSSVDALYQTVRARYGHADVLINNAGVNLSQALLGEADVTSWWTDFEVNVKGTFMMSRGFLSLLGTERHGTIVNLSTGIATAIFPTWSSYSITKLAALKLAEYVAAEYPNVNAVALQPGVVDTDMVVGKS